MLQQLLNPANLTSILAVSLIFGFTLDKLEDKFSIGVKSARIYLQSRKIKGLHTKLDLCYAFQEDDKKASKLEKCLIKARGKLIKVNKCREKHGTFSEMK